MAVKGSEWISALYCEQYEKMRKRLYAIVQSYGAYGLYDEVDDCIAETFAELCEQADRLRHHENIGGWLATTARYKLIDHFDSYIRHSKAVPYSLDAEGGAERAGRARDRQAYYHALERELTQEQIESIKAYLKPEDYRLLLLYYDKEISNELLAKRMNLTPGSLRARVSRLVRGMRRAEVINIFTFLLLQIRLLRR